MQRGFSYSATRALRRLGLVSLLAATFLSGFAVPARAVDAQCVNAGSGSGVSWARWECVFEVQAVNGNTFSGRRGYADTRLKVTFSASGQYARTS